MARSLRWTIVLVLAAAAAVLFFGLRMYRTDIKELKRFIAAYDRFDTAMAEVALRGQGDVTADVTRALSDLQTYAGMRLSSLIKNDAELMAQARTIADLAERELEVLRSYHRAAREGERQELASRWTLQNVQRKAAGARFKALAGVRD